MEPSDPDPHDEDHDGTVVPLRRWVLWYPVGVLAFVTAMLIWAPRKRDTERATALDRVQPAGELEAGPPPPSPGGPQPDADSDLGPDEHDEGGDDGERSNGLGALTGLAGVASSVVQARALQVLDELGERLDAATTGIDERFDLRDLLHGGERAARFAPYLGPYLRFRRARGLYRSDDLELQAKAKRQTVIALAELAIDAGSGGLDHAAAGSTGMLDVLEGVVDLADFLGLALSIHEELGTSLGLERLAAASLEVDELAGRALVEVEGLDRLVVTLLELEVDPLLARLPPELAARIQALVDPPAPADAGEH